MRYVAGALALMMVALAMPATAIEDDCATPCQRIDAAGATYYVYAQGAACTPLLSAACRGQGGDVVGIVFQESGSCAGLQRISSIRCGADVVVIY